MSCRLLALVLTVAIVVAVGWVAGVYLGAGASRLPAPSATPRY